MAGIQWLQDDRQLSVFNWLTPYTLPSGQSLFNSLQNFLGQNIRWIQRKRLRDFVGGLAKPTGSSITPSQLSKIGRIGSVMPQARL